MYTGIVSEKELISKNTSFEFLSGTARGLKTYYFDCLKCSQIGVHYFLVYLFQLLYMFWSVS